MPLNADIYAALKTLAGGRVYRDRAPQTVTDYPRIVFVRVGGASINFLDTATLPTKRGARIQVNCWDTTRDGADALALQVDEALRAVATLQTEVLGEPVSMSEDDREIYGTMQDFLVWA